MNAPFDFDRLTVDDVSHHFGRRRALAHVSFSCQRGEILGLLGPNGAGKSTLLAIIATLVKPTSGRVRYGHTAPPDGGSLRGRIGLLAHELHLYGELTAQENLEFFGELYGLRPSTPHVSAALERAGLADRGQELVSRFSRGMRQRLALERAILHEPRLALLDEPFTGLDDASTRALLGRLRSLRQGGAIVLLATHDLDVVEDLLDRAVFLRDGRIVDAVDQPATLRSTYRAVMSRDLTLRSPHGAEGEGA